MENDIFWEAKGRAFPWQDDLQGRGGGGGVGGGGGRERGGVEFRCQKDVCQSTISQPLPGIYWRFIIGNGGMKKTLGR